MVVISACGPSYVKFTSGQAASIVIGQADFTSESAGATEATTLDLPHGVVVYKGTLYIAEGGNSRVLGFNSIPTSNGAAADFVLGQTDFVTGSSDTTAATLWNPIGLSVGSKKLAIADQVNHRVLIYNSIPKSTGVAADVVVGQTDMVSRATACSSTGLKYPEGAFIQGERLIVSESSQHRVLIYNSIPTSNGAAPDLVIGQEEFDSCASNRGGAIGAETLSAPSAIWSDGKRLLVVDSGNNRVLIWKKFPTSNGQAADLVLGQADFTGSGSATTASGLNSPTSVWSKDGQVFIGDGSNSRVLIWNHFPTKNGQAADVVLGQPDFTSGVSSTTTQSTIRGGTYGVVLSGKKLIVTDQSANRALIFEGK